MTGIHTYTDLRGAQDRVKYAVGCDGPQSSLVCVCELVGEPTPLAIDTHGGSTSKMSIGEEGGECYGKTSFLSVL